jgi:transcriptional regulator with XRE-family HTH domain
MDALGVKQNTISQYETGRAVPSIGVLVKLHALAPDGPEKQFLRDYTIQQLKLGPRSHPELAEGVFESLTSREELLKKITPPKGRRDPQLQRFADLCALLLEPDCFIDKSVNDILEMWLYSGAPTDPDPETIPLFRDAAAYLRVQLDRLAEDGPPAPSEAKTKRMLAALGVRLKPEEWEARKATGKKVDKAFRKLDLDPNLPTVEKVERMLGELGAPGFEPPEEEPLEVRPRGGRRRKERPDTAHK